MSEFFVCSVNLGANKPEEKLVITFVSGPVPFRRSWFCVKLRRIELKDLWDERSAANIRRVCSLFIA